MIKLWWHLLLSLSNSGNKTDLRPWSSENRGKTCSKTNRRTTCFTSESVTEIGPLSDSARMILDALDDVREEAEVTECSCFDEPVWLWDFFARLDRLVLVEVELPVNAAASVTNLENSPFGMEEVDGLVERAEPIAEWYWNWGDCLWRCDIDGFGS